MDRFLTWASENPQLRVPLLVAIIGIGSAIIGGFFTTLVWPSLKSLVAYGWDKMTTRFHKRKFEVRYLEWLINEHLYLPVLPTTLVPVTESKVQELDKLYVSLAVTEDARKAQEVSLHKVMHEYPALVILGDPGAGKTTTLRFLALTFGRARRRTPPSKSAKQRKKEAPAYKEARRRVMEEFGIRECPLPVFVYLNSLRDVADWPKDRTLLDAVRDELTSVDGLRDLPTKFFDEKLASGQCAILFDAFDELASAEARDAIALRIGQLAASAPPGNRFIVTSRIVGYKGQLSRYGFRTITIQSLSPELIDQLVTRWYDSLNEPDLAKQLVETLRNNPRIVDLAVNPMLLSLIVLVQYVRRLIPDRRHVLYDECVKILVERRYAPPQLQEQYNEILPGDEAVRLLRQLALAMHKAHLSAVPRIDMTTGYIHRILEEMPTSRAAAARPAELLHNIEQRSQLLVERGLDEREQPVMAFSHLTFQEYLSSVALKELTGQRGEEAISDELIWSYEADPEWWKEVALLYAAQLDGLQQHAFLQRLYPGHEITAQ